MEKRIKSALTILVCSLLLVGCSPITIGPQVENNAIIVNAGTGIEVLQNIKVKCHVLTDTDGEVKVFRQDIGGWITLHPDHWNSLKKELKRLREKAGE